MMRVGHFTVAGVPASESLVEVISCCMTGESIL